jgi:hypothetical protein
MKEIRYLVVTIVLLIIAGANYSVSSEGESDLNSKLLSEADKRGSGDLNQIQDLIMQGADVNATNKYGITALHEAAGWNNVPLIKLLLDHRADINAKNRFGETPLSIAAGQGREDAFRVLMGAGADINAGNPLAQALRRVHVHIADELLKVGAKIDEAAIEWALTEFLTPAGATLLIERVKNEDPDLYEKYKDQLAIKLAHPDVQRAYWTPDYYGLKPSRSSTFEELSQMPGQWWDALKKWSASRLTM